MIKVSSQQEAITLINSYAPSTGAPKYTTQVSTDVKGEIDNNTVTVDFNTMLTSMDRSSRKKKINKEIGAVKDTLDQMDLIDTFRAFHPKAAEIHSFQVHRTFSRIDHMLGHKTRLDNFKETEVVSSVFSDKNGTKPEMNYKKKTKPHKHREAK